MQNSTFVGEVVQTTYNYIIGAVGKWQNSWTGRPMWLQKTQTVTQCDNLCSCCCRCCCRRCCCEKRHTIAITLLADPEAIPTPPIEQQGNDDFR
eukprot:3435286-Amphidinium_carterae.1